MKQSGKKLVALIAAIVMVCGMFLACSGNSSATYTTTYNITKDYMTENADTGALEMSGFPKTPVGETQPAVGYAGSFGAFVDEVTVDAKLEVKDGEYTYTITDHCGTDANAMGSYSPVYTWSGKVVSSDKTSVKVAAPTKATITLHSAGQFATNEEMQGIFGSDGYTATESTTDCPYVAVPSGEALLSMFVAGTFSVNGSTLGDFIAD